MARSGPAAARQRSGAPGGTAIDEEMLRECFEQCWAPVVRYLVRRGAHACAEDLAAQTFEIAWSKWGDVPSTPLPWLLRTAGFCWANERRRTQRAGELAFSLRPVMTDDPAHDRYNEDQDMRAVLAAVADLGEREREALMLTAWDGLSVRDAARVVDCSASALKVRVHRARSKIRQRFKDDPGPVGAEELLRSLDPDVRSHAG